MRKDEPVKLDLPETSQPQNVEVEKKPEIIAEVQIDEEEKDFLNWNGYDAFCLFVLVMVGIFCRFWIIQYPRHFTLNEEKHVQYINSYLNGSFFFPSQPPMSEIMLAGISAFSQYKGGYKPPYHEDNFTFPNMEYVALRSPSAFFSAIVIPLSFFIVRLLGGSTITSFAAGLFTMFDFLLVGLARNITTDGFIQLFVGMAIFATAFMKHFEYESTSYYICYIAQSAFVGLAFASDWNCIAVLAFVIFYNYFTFKKVKPIFTTLISLFIILYITYMIHVILLPRESPQSIGLSIKYQKSLSAPSAALHINHLQVPIFALELIYKSIRLHIRRSNFVNFLSWPPMLCSWKILWTQLGRTVAVFGNLPVWWAISLLSIIQILNMFFAMRIRKQSSFMYCGYFMTLCVFLFKTSERGFPDYQVPVLFGIWGLSLSLDTEFSEQVSGFLTAFLILASTFIFILWAPLVYGYENFDTRFTPYFAQK